MIAHIKSLFGVLFVCTFLGGCGFQPMYGGLSDKRRDVAQWRAIAVIAPSDRLGLRVRTLLLASQANDALKTPEYRLSFDLKTQDEPAIQALNTSTLRIRFQVLVSFSLLEVATHTVVLQGNVVSSALYDRMPGVPFANTQAERNAQERVAQDLAVQIRLKVGAFLAPRERS